MILGSFFHQLTFALSAGIISDPEMMSEADLRVAPLWPLLQNIAHCTSSMAYVPPEESQVSDADAIEYASSFSVEVNTDLDKANENENPMWTGFSNDSPLYAIPVEAKRP